jgi:hypothetical protein
MCIQMIPLHVRTILYGFHANVPPGGFPTQGYKNVMDTLEQIKNEITIFPKTAYDDVCNYFYWSQKSRWAFKRLLGFWNTYRFRNKIANEEDIYGNSFEIENTLVLWDWNTRMYYQFTRDELIGIFTAKLQENIHPTNPYTNIPFTYAQCVRIHTFVGDTDSFISVYTRFPKNMYLNTQAHMNERGFQNIDEYFPNTPQRPAEKILLREILKDVNSIQRDKEELRNEIENTMYKLLLHEQDTPICFVPSTQIEAHLYLLYTRYGLHSVIQWVKNWKRKNMRRFRIKHRRSNHTLCRNVCE